jgi:DNA-directed RNA polymerase specialized sigma24 family protein
MASERIRMPIQTRAAAGRDHAEHDDDASVIGRSRNEPEVFEIVFRRYADQIQRYVARRIGADAADDVVAETFLLAFGQRDRYDLSRASARPWLYGIATNLIGRYRRTEVRHYRALARAGVDHVAESFTDRVDAAVSARGEPAAGRCPGCAARGAPRHAASGRLG